MSRRILSKEYEENGFRVVIVGTYWDVQDKERNKSILEGLRRIREREDKIIFVGDFNAHMEEIDGRNNWNGSVLREFIKKERLINVNVTNKCRGKYTWSRNGVETVIDCFLVDENLWKEVTGMRIDENKEVDVKSGHNFMELSVGVRKKFEKRRREKERQK